MKTIILAAEGKDTRPIGTWLRDLGFKLIEAGCEVNLTRLDGPAAQELLANRGLEVVHVVDAYAPKVATQAPNRVGARAYPAQPQQEESHFS